MVHPLITLSSLMRPLSNTKRRETIDLLSAGYSAHQVAAKLGIGKSTVGRLLQELDCDKENRRGGGHFKLTESDTHTLICQITTGRMDNAVEAAQYINNHLDNPITPQTVCNALKKNDFRPIVKAK